MVSCRRSISNMQIMQYYEKRFYFNMEKIEKPLCSLGYPFPHGTSPLPLNVEYLHTSFAACTLQTHFFHFTPILYSRIRFQARIINFQKNVDARGSSGSSDAVDEDLQSDGARSHEERLRKQRKTNSQRTIRRKIKITQRYRRRRDRRHRDRR